jgi:hypothetical protein
MYLHWLWSVALLSGVFSLYWFVIRPRARFLEVGRNWLDRLHRFRSYIATAITAMMLALPDIAVAVAPVDLSGIVGHWWAQLWTTALAIFLAVNRAMSTTPPENK